MGAWGIQPFDDDTAMELVEDQPDWMVLKEKLSTVAIATDGYIEFTEAVHAWTAAAIVALALGATFDDIDGEVVEMAAAMGQPPSNLSALAVEALRRLESGNSHLYELWEDSEDFEDWRKGLAALRMFLEAQGGKTG